MKEDLNENLLDLLATKATQGLSKDEERDLERLQADFPEMSIETWELAAAALSLTNLDISEPMPKYLREKVMAGVEQYFRENQTSNVVRLDEFSEKRKAKPAGQTMSVVSASKSNLPASPNRFWQWSGWAVAAAACLLLAFTLWQNRIQTNVPIEITKNSPTPLPSPTLLEQEQQLLASARDIVKTNWTEPDPKKAVNITGDVVWSGEKQSGFMRFRGIPVNDTAKETYQLWIFDENQDEKTPVDGGVFDVKQNGEVIVPIDAKLKVKNPKMFAITIEKPGGVVVSKREKLILIAKV
jgi:anti-sigma-K factor RskA